MAQAEWDTIIGIQGSGALVHVRAANPTVADPAVLTPNEQEVGQVIRKVRNRHRVGTSVPLILEAVEERARLVDTIGLTSLPQAHSAAVLGDRRTCLGAIVALTFHRRRAIIADADHILPEEPVLQSDAICQERNNVREPTCPMPHSQVDNHGTVFRNLR